jgi:hypothetical protein
MSVESEWTQDMDKLYGRFEVLTAVTVKNNVF